MRDDDERRSDAPPERAAERRGPPPSASVDPLFDQPYEATGGGAPQWEVSQPAPLNRRRAVSANIKPKRKVASLLGGGGG